MGYHILKMLLKWLSMLDSLDVYMSEHPTTLTTLNRQGLDARYNSGCYRNCIAANRKANTPRLLPLASAKCHRCRRKKRWPIASSVKAQDIFFQVRQLLAELDLLKTFPKPHWIHQEVDGSNTWWFQKTILAQKISWAVTLLSSCFMLGSTDPDLSISSTFLAELLIIFHCEDGSIALPAHREDLRQMLHVWTTALRLHLCQSTWV